VHKKGEKSPHRTYDATLMPQSQGRTPMTALRIAAAFLVFGVVWILLSDRLL
jgi:hypothetical protein